MGRSGWLLLIVALFLAASGKRAARKLVELVWPTSKGRERLTASRRFGAPRPGGRTHRGIDLGERGDEVLAVRDGVVKAVRVDLPGSGSSVKAESGVEVVEPGPGGLMVFLSHPGSVETRYMHLDSASVREGQAVKAGEVIGRVGRTGIKHSAAHLHFEWLENGRHINPTERLT